MATDDGKDALIQKVLRITDIAEEPLEFLAAISGYEEKPIVSIEEAVKPLVSILPFLESYTYTAKMMCHDPSNGLTQDYFYFLDFFIYSSKTISSNNLTNINKN